MGSLFTKVLYVGTITIKDPARRMISILSPADKDMSVPYWGEKKKYSYTLCMETFGSPCTNLVVTAASEVHSRHFL